MRVSGTSGLLWTRILCAFMMPILLMVVTTALPHCPGVPINGILPSVIVAMVTAVTLMFELAVAPLFAVVVPMVGAAASFRRVEFVLRGGLLEIIVAKVLLGVVVPMKALLFP